MIKLSEYESINDALNFYELFSSIYKNDCSHSNSIKMASNERFKKGDNFNGLCFFPLFSYSFRREVASSLMEIIGKQLEESRSSEENSFVPYICLS